MHNKRRAAAHKVADKLFATERAINAAFQRAAELNAAMPEAQADAEISTVVGQEAFDRTAALLGTLAAARRQVVEAHEAMDATRVSIGLRTVAFGDGGQKPPLFPSAVADGEARAA